METKAQDQSDLVHTPVTILHTPLRRRVISRPAVSTVTVIKTVSIPTSTQDPEERSSVLDQREDRAAGDGLDNEEQGTLAVSVSTESINVTDD